MQIIDPKRLSVVTVGPWGIGLAITEKFITPEISTVMIGRDLNKPKDIESSFGNLCKTIAFDLNDLAGTPALVEKIISKFSDINILINNAISRKEAKSKRVICKIKLCPRRFYKRETILKHVNK